MTSNISNVIQPQSSQDWRDLHRAHVLELSRRYDEMFRHFSEIEAIVISSGRASPKNSRDDQEWPFVATPHFSHWSPYQETPALLIVRPSATPQLFTLKHTSFWEGSAPRNELWDTGSFDIEEVSSLTEIQKIGPCVFIGDDLSVKPASAMTSDTETHIMRMLDSFRTQKTNYEIASIREATNIAVGGHRKLRDLFLSGMSVSELDLHYDYLKTTRQRELTVPYGDIVAIGRNAAILHHVHYDTTCRGDATSLLVDAGATFNGLASDITRTWVRGETAGAQLFRKLTEGVERVQQDLCQRFVIGTTYESLHNLSHGLLASVLQEIGLTTASTEDLVESGATRCLFPHGLGHSLGLQVHDVGMKYVPSASQNSYLRNTSIILPGQVVTVEPGIYFIETLLTKLKGLRISNRINWEMIELLKPFGGVRIEDNLLATEMGPVNLTRETAW